MSRFKESPSQTAGPYVHIGCTPNASGLVGVYAADLGAVMVGDGAEGERISIAGRVLDGFGAPLRDALIEIWQADSKGRYPSPEDDRPADPAFTGWGRAAADAVTGEWRFDTIRPGCVPHPGGGVQAPHVTFWIVARGINLGLHTRMYFPEDDLSVDPALSRLEHQARAKTLVATKEGPGAYRFDIRLQGADETIFFES